MDKNKSIYMEALKCTKNKKYIRAKELLNSIIKSGYKKQVLELLIEIAKNENDIDNVRHYYRVLLNEKTKYQCDILQYWAEYEALVGNVETARKIYLELLNTSSFNSLTIRNDLGLLEMKIGNYKLARKYFEDVLFICSTLHSSNFKKDEAYANLEIAHLDMLDENYEKAKNRFKWVMSFGDKYSCFALRGLAQIEVLNNNIEKAYEYYDKIILSNKLDKKTNITIIQEYIILLLRNKKLEKAKQLIEENKDNHIDSNYYRFNNYLELYIENPSEEKKEERHKSIIRHIKNSHENDFLDTVNIEEMYYNVLEVLKDSKENPIGTQNVFYISFDEDICIKDGKNTNCLQVVTFIDKFNIITMFPVIWYGDTIKINQKTKKLN